jgi:dual specificity MAP kinase phosphatase
MNQMTSDIKYDFSDDEYDYPDKEPTEKWIYDMYRDYNWYKPLFINKDNTLICVRKVKKGNIYKKCKTQLVNCKRCYSTLCPNKECIPQYMIRNPSYTTPSKKHEKCLDCNNITCCPSGFCDNCEKHHTYDMITDMVAIGSYQASYDQFDLIINLDYPENNVKFGKIVTINKGNKRIIACGYNDTIKDGGLTYDKLEDLLNRIDDFKKEIQKDIKILFHCYAGISRSSTVAIAYLSKINNKTTKEIYELVKEKRPRINPNETFRKMIELD